jgi:FSR family fosmidomycin resistance protein-like MFS transporter
VGTKKQERNSFNLGMVILFAFAHLGHHITGALIAPLSPFIRDYFSLDYTLTGWIASSYLICYGISQLPGGWFADRIGPRIVITIGVCGVAIAGLLAGLAPNYIMLVIFLALAGLLGGGYHPSSVPLISELSDRRKRGRALGLHQIGGAASHFLAPLFASALVLLWGWRGAYITPSIIIFLFGIVFFILLSKKGYKGKIHTHKEVVVKETTEDSSVYPRLIVFLIFAIVVDFLIGATIIFLPLFLVDHFQFSNEVASATLAIAYSAGLWAGPLAGHLSDRIGSLPVLLTVSLLVCPVIFFFDMLSAGWIAYLFLLVIGMAQYARMPVNEIYFINNAPEKHRSKILGIYYFGSRGGPGVITPLIGYTADTYGFGLGMKAIGVAIFVVTVICGPLIMKNKSPDTL